MIQSHVRRARTRADAVRARLAALAFSSVLAACGGGGGAGPALVIQASATSTNASGPDITLTASIRNSSATDTPTWSLSGPGTLSATSGTSVTYVPPDSEADANDGAATATVTATAGTLTRQLPITLVAKAFPGHHWSIGPEPLASLDTVVYANGLFVVGGAAGQFATSVDGKVWTHHDTAGDQEWTSVAYTNNGWLALDTAQNTLLTSTDGVSWTHKPEPAAAGGNTLGAVAYGNGITVILGYTGVSLASTDGATWTASSLTGRRIVYGNGVFVALQRTQQLAWSADGVTWTTPAQPTGIYSVAFNNGHFVATTGTEIWTSADGKAWVDAGASSVNLGSECILTSVNATLYCHTGYNGVFAATDDLTWAAVPLPVQGVEDLATGAGQTVVVTSLGSLAVGADLAHLSILRYGDGGNLGSGLYADGHYLFRTSRGLYSSTDGTSFSFVDFAPPGGYLFGHQLSDGGINGIASAPDGTIVVSGTFDVSYESPITGAAAFAWSSDGATWNFAQPQGVAADDNYEGVIVHDGHRFLSVGITTGYIHASTDGRTWSTVGRIALGGASATGLAYANGRYVLVGTKGFAATSTDGVAWTVGPKVLALGSSSAGFNMGGVVYAAGKFIAVGVGANVATSPDGVTWTVAATAAPTGTNFDIPAGLNSIAVDASGEIVAVGNNGLIETSRDGVHWTLRQSGPYGQLQGVAVTPTGFMAGGQDEAVLLSTN